MSRRSAFADRLLEFPEFVFSDGAELKHRGAWREFFGDRIGPAFGGGIIFEIGCNDAMLLVRVAAKHPAVGFIGIDWKCRALHTAAERVTAAGLPNIALLHGRAQDIGRIFADGEVDEIWVFHPDPCDKPNEAANRLISEPFLIDAEAALRDAGSLLLLKTDHRPYYDSAQAALERPQVEKRFALSASSTDFWNDPAILAHSGARRFSGLTTSFEERFRKKRKPIYYLEMRRRQPPALAGGILDRTPGGP